MHRRQDEFRSRYRKVAAPRLAITVRRLCTLRFRTVLVQIHHHLVVAARRRAAGAARRLDTAANRVIRAARRRHNVLGRQSLPHLLRIVIIAAIVTS